MKPLLIISLFLIPSPLLAQAPSTAADAPATAPTADPADKMVCKARVATGSRLGRKRICMTRRDWALAAKEDQKAMQDRIAHGAAQGF